MAVPTQITTYATDALALYTGKFKGLPALAGITKAIMAECQLLENVFYSFLTAWQFATPPVGDQLTQLGVIVGQPRLSMTDADLLEAIKIKIAVNRSQGRAEDIIQIGALLSPQGPGHYVECYPAGFVWEKWNLKSPVSAASLLGGAKAEGTRGVLHYSNWVDGSDFEWGSRYNANTGELGWGSRYSAGTGGLQVTAKEISE